MKKRSREFLILSECTLYLCANIIGKAIAGKWLAVFQTGGQSAQGASDELELTQITPAGRAIERVHSQSGPLAATSALGREIPMQGGSCLRRAG